MDAPEETPPPPGESSNLPGMKETALSVEYDCLYDDGRIDNSHSSRGSRVSGSVSQSFEGYLPKFNNEISLAGADAIIRYYENEAGYMELLRDGFFLRIPAPSDEPVIYYDYADYSVAFPVECYLTVTRYHERYMGGAHPTHQYSVDNFNLKTGRLLTLNDLFGDTAAARTQLGTLIMKQLETDGRVGALFKSVTAKTLAGKLDNNHYQIDKEGITFIFNEYEIAPYVVGTILVTIPYSQLKELLFIDVFEKVE